MATTKLRIDLSQGTVEVEGDESFVAKVYQDFKDRVGQEFTPPVTPDNEGDQSSAPATKRSRKQQKPKQKPDSTSSEAPKIKKKVSGSLSIVSNLDLSGSKAGRLKDFYAKYEPATNYEKSLIFVYFMEQKMGLKGITADHVYTCYKDVSQKVPEALIASLRDVMRHKGWITASDMNNLTVPVPGQNYIEHDMPKAGKGDKSAKTGGKS